MKYSIVQSALRRQSILITISTLQLILICYIDKITEFSFSMSGFYVIPIILVAWFGSRTAAILFALLSATLWFFVDLGHPYGVWYIGIWNAINHLVLYLIIVYTVAWISANTKERIRVSEAKLAKLHSLLPLCAWCKKLRNDNGYWQEVDEYLKLLTNQDITHGICPDCIKKLKKE